MSSPNLLNINVDKLFEQHNVSEIDQIHKKLQDEIERKREELRTQVGERYRDLLKAADTIGDMKVTANSLIQNVDNIIRSCKTLNDQHLIGFKSEKEYQKVVKKNISNNFHGIIVQIKILTTLPEIIWTNIDNEDYFTATQLFILSRHISTGLQLDTNNDIIKKFPVAKKQWSILSQFFFTIKQSCLATLEREELTADKAANCLASLFLLENCQLEKLLTIFIQMRSKAFVNILAEDNPKYDKAKDKILASLNLLNVTVQLIYECFNSPGLLMNELKKITDNNSAPTLSLMLSDGSIIIQTLPDIISKFKPRIQINDLSDTAVSSNMHNYVQYIDGVAKNQLKNLINLITSIKVIHQIKKTASTTLNRPKDWNQICQKLSLPENLDFYKHFYQNSINLKIKDIVKTSWSLTVVDTTKEFSRLIEGAERNSKSLKSVVWTEEDGDIPQNLKAALDREKLANHKLLMKCRGYTFEVVEICNFIDRRLELLYKDVALYLDDESESNLLKNDNEFELIVENLRECSKESVSGLISALKSNFCSTENLVILARFLSAIRELCPHLKLCLSANVKNWSQQSMDNSCDQWNTVCCLLNDESLRFWRLWIDEFTNSWPEISSNVEIQTVLQDFPLWDTITIEEKDEQEQTIDSIIRVPSQPSFTLHKFFHQICKNLNKFVPQTIPKMVTQQITEKIVEKLYDSYQELSNCEFVQKNQNAALQYYFDVKFVQLMFVGREQKTMSEQYSQLVNTFKGLIDPFDFDVFYSHLNINVKKCGVRMIHLLGNLVPNMDQLSVILGNNQYKQEKDPNILALSTNSSAVMFFPLLPVVNTSKTSAGNLNVLKANELTSNQNRQKTKETRQQPPTTTSTSASKTTQNYANAMAFFGLDKDWFK